MSIADVPFDLNDLDSIDLFISPVIKLDGSITLRKVLLGPLVSDFYNSAAMSNMILACEATAITGRRDSTSHSDGTIHPLLPFTYVPQRRLADKGFGSGVGVLQPWDHGQRMG